MQFVSDKKLWNSGNKEEMLTNNNENNQEKLILRKRLQQQHYLCPIKSLLPAAATQHCPEEDFRLEEVDVTVL
jgi:hypothetical protein